MQSPYLHPYQSDMSYSSCTSTCSRLEGCSQGKAAIYLFTLSQKRNISCIAFSFTLSILVRYGKLSYRSCTSTCRGLEGCSQSKADIYLFTLSQKRNISYNTFFLTPSILVRYGKLSYSSCTYTCRRLEVCSQSKAVIYLVTLFLKRTISQITKIGET